MVPPPAAGGGLTTTAAAARDRWPVAAAAVLGGLAGTTALHATSIGWHLASGRWILHHRQWLRSDPFSFTAAGTPWVDHEWLFQVAVAAVERLGGPVALVGLRALLTAALGALLCALARRAGLRPGLAFALAAVAIAGARMRFFMRPELVTLLVVPAVVALFLERDRLGTLRTTAAVAGLVVIGANCHAGVFAAPALIAFALAGDALASASGGRLEGGRLASGAAVLAAAALAPLVNPYGVDLYLVPLRLAELIGQPFIPNPEWAAPGLGDVPALFAAAAVAAGLLAAAERRPARWFLFAAATALAMRSVRHVGLFFVILPVVAAPALARLSSGRTALARHEAVIAGLVAAILAVGWVIAPWPPFGVGPWAPVYPVAACDRIEDEGLWRWPVYNDVNFGGYILGRDWPPHPVFLDDRNEIHASLLAEIWRQMQTSDVGSWQAMLDRYGIRTALVRYHPPTTVRTPDGAAIGRRGFSALWLPTRRWALIYWDDQAMVLVDREAFDPGWLAAREYRVVRPDDGEELARGLAAGTIDPAAVARELARALAESPGSERALALGKTLLDR